MFNAYAPMSYDAVYVAAKGLAAANTVDGDALLAILYPLEHDGASGKIRFNELGEVQGRFDYVQLQDETYVSFGEWGLPPGATIATATLTDTSLTLADGSEWEIAGNKVTMTKEPEAERGIPGFRALEVIFALSLLGVAFKMIRRKRRRR